MSWAELVSSIGIHPMASTEAHYSAQATLHFNMIRAFVIYLVSLFLLAIDVAVSQQEGEYCNICGDGNSIQFPQGKFLQAQSPREPSNLTTFVFSSGVVSFVYDGLQFKNNCQHWQQTVMNPNSISDEFCRNEMLEYTYAACRCTKPNGESVQWIPPPSPTMAPTRGANLSFGAVSTVVPDTEVSTISFVQLHISDAQLMSDSDTKKFEEGFDTILDWFFGQNFDYTVLSTSIRVVSQQFREGDIYVVFNQTIEHDVSDSPELIVKAPFRSMGANLRLATVLTDQVEAIYRSPDDGLPVPTILDSNPFASDPPLVPGLNSNAPATSETISRPPTENKLNSASIRNQYIIVGVAVTITFILCTIILFACYCCSVQQHKKERKSLRPEQPCS